MEKKIVVIKFGGNALTIENAKSFCEAVAQLPYLGFSPVIIHGGGPQIDDMLNQVGICSHFIDGIRYTDKETLCIVEMVLSGHINKLFVHYLSESNASAVGLSGKDGKTLVAEKVTHAKSGEAIDLGFVGEVYEVNPYLINLLIENKFIPVISPLAYGLDSCTYNVNADYAAAAVASVLHAQHFVMMTNVDGLLDANNQVIHYATANDINHLIREKTISEGMIPKTLSAISTLKTVKEVNLIHGGEPDALLRLLSGERVGTRICSS